MNLLAYPCLADLPWERLRELLQFRLATVLLLAVTLFAIGAWGVLARRNVIINLISVEVMLNAVILAFAALARTQAQTPDGGASGQLFAVFIIAVAAAEAAVGLAIVILCFRQRNSVDTRDFGTLKR